MVLKITIDFGLKTVVKNDNRQGRSAVDDLSKLPSNSFYRSTFELTVIKLLTP